MPLNPVNQQPSRPISILKNSTTSSSTKNARIVLSDDDTECFSDGDEDMEPMSAEALELLESEKVIKAGYLLKKGEKRRTWKKRWFVLKSTKLAMYKNKKEYKLLRIIDLYEIHKIVQVTTKNKYKNVFALVTPKRMYYVQADNQKDMDEWFTHLQKVKQEQRLYQVENDREYAKDVIRRLSTTSSTIDSSDQHQIIESSEDEFDNEFDINIQQEESRNRVLIEGYLLKLGRNKGWRKRWFVLRTDTLAYYEDDKEYSPHRIIPLDRIIDSLEIDPISKSKQHCFKIIIPKRSYVLCASSENDMDSWLNALIVANKRAKSQLPESEKILSHASADSFENLSHVSGVSGAGGVGGAGGALGITPTSTSSIAQLHLRATERLARAK